MFDVRCHKLGEENKGRQETRLAASTDAVLVARVRFHISL